MSMSPLEMARFGELYRQQGRWDGELVMADDWVMQSFKSRTVSAWSNDGYGWFLRPMGDHIAAYARGYGGQLLHVIPQAGVVVAITSDTTRAARSDGYMATLHLLVENYLLAMQGKDGGYAGVLRGACTQAVSITLDSTACHPQIAVKNR